MDLVCSEDPHDSLQDALIRNAISSTLLLESPSHRRQRLGWAAQSLGAEAAQSLEAVATQSLAAKVAPQQQVLCCLRMRCSLCGTSTLS